MGIIKDFFNVINTGPVFNFGNDLSTPRPEYGFVGLKPGDHWCLCAGRFLQAHEEGCAPKVNLSATHARALEIVSLEILQAYQL